MTLILLNIAAFVAETVPDIARQHHAAFHAFEIFSVAVFTIEYGLRLWTAVEVPFLSRLSPWAARLRFAGRPSSIIDFLAIAPFYLGSLIGLDLRALRALRLLRFFKLSRYSPAMHSLIRVLVSERRALIGAGLLLMTAVLFASTGIYLSGKRGAAGQVRQRAASGLVGHRDADHGRLRRRHAGDDARPHLRRRRHGDWALHPGAAGRHHRRRLLAGGEPPRLRGDVVA